MDRKFTRINMLDEGHYECTDDGEWVAWDEVEAEIDRLKAELDNAADSAKKWWTAMCEAEDDAERWRTWFAN